MINFNGTLLDSESELASNRAFLYGDAVFETIKVYRGKILFLEDHYFRLMASMRIIRMKIPMEFTMEFIESQILDLTKQMQYENSARVRITVYRNNGGLYLPTSNEVSYLIQAFPLENSEYKCENLPYEVELFKDFYVVKQLLSTIKTTNKLINVVGSIFANENGYQNCLLLNEDKNVVEALNGNIFMLTNGVLKTPSTTEGCVNGIMRKQIFELAKTNFNFTIEEGIISPFDLQKADELFITNVISGVIPVTKYRKKEYEVVTSKELVRLLNISLLLN